MITLGYRTELPACVITLRCTYANDHRIVSIALSQHLYTYLAI